MINRKLLHLVIISLVLVLSMPSWALEEKASVSYLKGSAFKTINGKDWIPISKGDSLSAGETVKTSSKSRLELSLPDKSKLRFSEKTTFKVETLLFKKDERNFGIKIFLGRAWTKASKLTGNSRFEVKTVNAVAGIRGTTYRIDVNDDTSSLVRVYDGEVSVGSLPVKSEDKIGKKYVPGPTEVPGPHEVTREEWSYIVKSWQQISVSPKGVASMPTSFDPSRDAEDWVTWNQEMDKL